ncbi:MAG TPA: hypothetical protein VLB45_06330 [Nitrosopumilaceae archaeon]|nr:hypothetical protein [Nitrosopumilaceae archaeon]
MKRETAPRLSVFETFKTKREELTGEALRQRSIITHLATESSPAMKTRTAIAHKIAEKNGTVWQNLYSGIFRDLDEILLPLGIVEEAGRLPLKRGPKALQEHGVPHYQLTEQGMLVAASLDELKKTRVEIMIKFLENSNTKDKEFKKVILTLLNVAPSFVFSLLEKYIEAYGNGKVDDLIPFDMNSLKNTRDKIITVHKELLEGFSTLPDPDKKTVIEFLKNVS